jgi:transposase
MTIYGACSGAVFLAYLEQVLVPTLRPGQVVIMDNLRAHKVAGVRELLRAAGCRVLYLPPYSPDMNPIEKAWAKLKNHLRSRRPRCFATINTAIAEAMRLITPRDAFGWFRFSGYVPST